MTKRLDSLNFHQGKELKLDPKSWELLDKLGDSSVISSVDDAKLALQLADTISRLKNGTIIKGNGGYEYVVDEDTKESFESGLDTMVIEYLQNNINSIPANERHIVERMIQDYQLTDRERKKLLSILKSDFKAKINRHYNTVTESLKSRGIDYQNESYKRALQIARDIDANGTGRIGISEITNYIQGKPYNLQAAIRNAWHYNRKDNGGNRGMKVEVFAKFLEQELKKIESMQKNYKTVSTHKDGEQITNDFFHLNSGTETKSHLHIHEKTESKPYYEKVILNFDERRDRRNKAKVIELQTVLVNLGYHLKGKNNGIDGNFGPSTKKAYESALATYRNIENVQAVRDFTEAYSKVYGATDKFINPKDGVVGLVLKNVTESDIETLKHRLGFNYKNVDKKIVNNFAKELGIKKDSPEYDRYLNKTLVEAGLSALISFIKSGGDNISTLIRVTGFNPHFIAKLFGVNNIGLIYKKAPSTDKILSVLLGRKVSYKKTAREAYIHGMKTNKEIKDTLKAYLEVDIPNLRRLIKELKGDSVLYNIPIIGSILGVLGDIIGDDFENLIRDLEKQRDGELNPEKVDDIMGKIGYKILPTLKNYIEKGGEKAKKAEKIYGELAAIIGRYTNIEQKYYKINGGLTYKAQQEIRKDEEVADRELRKLGYKSPMPLNETLYSRLSYGFDIGKSIRRYGRKGYVRRLAETLNPVSGHSMLATIAATLTEVTTGLSFSMKDLIKAMENIRKANKDYVKILSNVGVGKGQEFQGTIDNSDLYVIDLFGAKIYFKKECNNPVAVVNTLTGTLQYADSQGIYKKVSIYDKSKEEPTTKPITKPTIKPSTKPTLLPTNIPGGDDDDE